MKFRKKPVIIEAEQYTGEKLIDGMANDGFGNVFIFTHEGKMYVNRGDWIITGVNGEKYPCKPYIFELTYEELKD